MTSQEGSGVAPRRLTGLALVALTTVFSAALAEADVLLFTSTQLCPDADVNNGVFTAGVDHTEDAQQFQSGSAIMDGSAGATADYGTLSAYATVTLTDYAAGTYMPVSNPPSVLHATAGRAGFMDTWDILGAPADGGFLTFFFTVEGTVSNNGFGEAGGTISMQNFAYQEGFPSSGSYDVEFLIPFTSGSPLDIEVSLLAYTVALDYGFPNPYSYTGSADFFHTAVLDEVLISDVTGNPIAGAGINAASGVQYRLSSLNQPGVVPEPATVLLVGVGLAGAALRRTGRRLLSRRA